MFKKSLTVEGFFGLKRYFGLVKIGGVEYNWY